MRILITGKNGQVGTELSRLYQSHGDVVLAGREECDLSSEQSIRDLVRRVKPAVIINAGAYTAVDQAEKERALCFAVNAAAPRVLAEEAARLDALLIHYSTDYVFNGEKPGPYLESDPINPLSVYGASKAAGEAAIAEAASRYLVLRTSWVYRAHGKNFLRTMLRLGAERSELRVVDDQVGAPTSAAAIAAATARLVEQYTQSDRACLGNLSHDGRAARPRGMALPAPFSSAGILSTRRGCNRFRPPPIQLRPNGLPTQCLSNDKFARTFGFRLPTWQATAGTGIGRDAGRELNLEQKPTRLIDEGSSDHDCGCPTP